MAETGRDGRTGREARTAEDLLADPRTTAKIRIASSGCPHLASKSFSIISR
jgi:hypothetical protein